MKLEFSPYIAIQVQEHLKAVDFYKRVLGMDLIDERGSDCYMNKNGINFVFENKPEGAGSVFFEFKTDNLAEAKQELINEGCKITTEYNEHSIMFSDPFGMNFHVWEEGAFQDNP
ncbi:MAG: VOC family protein [Ignavibacteria bacterium]|nr:VOC family protein [Ignavibacteria bacterium]